MINRCRFSVIAEAVYIANILNFHGIGVKRIERKGEETVFTVHSADAKKAEEVLTKRGKEYKILADTSVRAFFKKNVFRFGIYTGILAVALLMYFYAGTLTRIDISGNKAVAGENICKVIEENLEIPGFNRDADYDALEKKLIALDGISGASVERKGNTLFVRVYEELPKVDVEDRTEFKDVVSKYDTIITRVITFSGTCKVKVGDTVKKGQTVISATVTAGEGVEAPSYANGIAYGRVWVTKEVIISQVQIEAVRTGNSVEHVVFFGKKDDFVPPFSQYETEKRECFLDAVIPLKYTVFTYYETKNAEKEVDFYANEEAIVKEHVDKMLSEIPEGSKVLRNWYDIKSVDKNIKLVIYYEIETKIT
ncbi:MAG TPA: sporulation protein YqfD [Clostridia bacterium]|nr:sporulation protein YqfD [Clostridia bacterium]